METPAHLTREASRVLRSLAHLCWKVVRFHSSPRGGLIVTATKNGLLAALELPLPNLAEAEEACVARLEALLVHSAYDPTDATPPVLVVTLPGDLADVVPHHAQTLKKARPTGLAFWRGFLEHRSGAYEDT